MDLFANFLLVVLGILAGGLPLPVCGKWLSKKRLTCLLKAKAGIYTDSPITPANKLVYDLEPLLIWCRAAAKASPSQVGKWLREGS